MTDTNPIAIRFTSPNTLLGVFQSEEQTLRLITVVAAIALGVITITMGAKVSIPLWPVPITLQSFAVALVAATFGMKVGVLTVVFYLLGGAMGLPLFAGGGSLSYLLGPTSGFLLGFMAQVAIIGAIADRGASSRPFLLFAGMMLGNLVMFTIGFAWLVAMAGPAQWVDQANVFVSAFSKAVQPFIIWDVLKMACAALCVSGVWALLVARR